MSNTQLYLAIGVPIIINTLFNGMMFIVINKRLDDLKDLWRAELRRVEEVMDARLKNVEDRLKHIEEAHI